MENLESRIKKELEVNENLISEERLSDIAADFVPDDTDIEMLDQVMVETEIMVENMIKKMGGKVDR
jgi:hypothetical protein